MAANTKQFGATALPRPWRESLSRWTKTEVVIGLSLVLIISLGAFLRFVDLGAYSIGNMYYAATVKSMLTSWHNFFFAAYEPGGSVMVDKPPLGFWVQAASAALFGVNGFALALPQALAGTLAIPLLYLLVKRQFGAWAGLVAALALSITPITIATERNNTIDGLLVLVLLLAAWAFWRAIESGRLRHLLLGALLVGLGFNIKMLQALLPLPAFYLLYLLGARHHRWWKRLLYLGLATVLLVGVSLSWAIAVDLTPAEDRPYVGSSENNTVMELIVGHNGIKRLNLSALLGGDGRQGAGVPRGGGMAQPVPPTGRSGPPPRPADPPTGGGPPPAPPNGGTAGSARQGAGPGQPGGVQGAVGPSETGQAGWLRLFTPPLADEATWLLPMALLGLLPALLVLGWPLSGKHLALVLWAGWLLPEVVYFTFNSGLFHTYYLIMLGPPLAALVGMVAWALWQAIRRWRWVGWALAASIATATLAVQLIVLRGYPTYLGWVVAAATPLLIGGLALLTVAIYRRRMSLGRVAWIVVLLSLMIAPLLWSGLTAFNPNPNVSLPRSGPDMGEGRGQPASDELLSPQQEAILAYLLAHTDPDDYLVAGLSSHDVSAYILATACPALTFGGFNGGDDVVDVEELARMVADGELRFVLGGDQLSSRKPEIGRWVEANCTVVDVPGVTRSETPGPGPGQSTTVYDCDG